MSFNLIQILTVVWVELTPTHLLISHRAVPPIKHRLPVNCISIESQPKDIQVQK